MKKLLLVGLSLIGLHYIGLIYVHLNSEPVNASTADAFFGDDVLLSDKVDDKTVIDECDSFATGVISDHVWHCRVAGKNQVKVVIEKGTDAWGDPRNFLQAYYLTPDGWHAAAWQMRLNTNDGLAYGYEQTVDYLKYTEYRNRN